MLSREFAMRMAQDFKDLLSALNAHHVKYLVIGGYAFGAYSEPRATKDIDIFIRADSQNSLAVFKALADCGAPLAGFHPSDFNDEAGSVFQIGVPPNRIDILQKITAVSFDEAWETRIETIVDGEILVPVISSDLLIRNKLAVGRPRDLLDVADIREAALERPDTENPNK
jgi:hypothetical protein